VPVEGPGDVDGRDRAVVEHADHEQVAVGVVTPDLRGQLAHPPRDVLLRHDYLG
jgi:hypothetical protein